MYYEVYIDILFLVNFMMDSLLLLLVWKILKCSTTHGCIFLGGAAGALSTCAIIILPIPYKFVKLLLFHVIANAIMIRIGLKIKFGHSFLRALLTLYVAAFLMGGVASWIHQYLRPCSLFFAVAVLSFYTAKGGLVLLAHIMRTKKNLCEVQLYTSKGIHQVRALIDTGNCLKDLYTKKPVSILEQKTARTVFSQPDMKGLHYVPFHTISEEHVLPVITVSKMYISYQDHDELREYWVEHPLIGICESNVSKTEEYQMILNPDILGGV